MALAFLAGCEQIDIQQRRGQLATDLPQDRLLFDDSRFGEAQQKQLWLYNAGAASLRLKSIDLLGAASRFFKLSQLPSLPLVLKPGRDAGAKLVVEFQSQAQQALVSRLRIVAEGAKNTDENGAFFVEISNRVRLAKLSISCGELDFGAVGVGRSKILPCGLSNTGSADLKIQAARYRRQQGGADFSLVGATFPRLLRPQESWKIHVQFAPTSFHAPKSEGSFELDADLQLGPGEKPPSLRVKGLLKARVLRLSPDYGGCLSAHHCSPFDPKALCMEQSQRCQPLPRELLFFRTSGAGIFKHRVRLEAVGALAVTLHKIEIVQTEGVYSYTSPGSSTVRPGAPLWVPIQLHPKAPIQTKDAQFVVHSDAQNSAKAAIPLKVVSAPCWLWLRGLGFLGGLDFGRAAFAERSLRLLNLGTQVCRSQLKLEGGEGAFSLESRAKLQTGAGEQWASQILLHFNPRRPKTYQARLLVESDDPRRPQISIPLKGQGVESEGCVRLSPATLEFGKTTPGCKVSRELQLYLSDGPGCGPVSIQGIALTDKKSFSLVDPPRFPLALKPGPGVRLSLSFSSAAVGPVDAQVLFELSKPSTKAARASLQAEVLPSLPGRDIFIQTAQKPLSRSFQLTHPALSKTLRVSVDAVPTSLYAYDARTHTITLDAAPQPGSMVRALYQADPKVCPKHRP